MEQHELKSKIEAVLFTTAKALKIKEIAEILGCEAEVAEEALLELIMDYASRDGALEIDDEDGYILQVKMEHMDIVEKLCPVELKPAVLKTLTGMLGIEVDLKDLNKIADETREKMKQAAAEAMGQYIDYFTQPIWEQGQEEEGDEGEEEGEP